MKNLLLDIMSVVDMDLLIEWTKFGGLIVANIFIWAFLLCLSLAILLGILAAVFSLLAWIWDKYYYR